jgi:DNA-binding PadR family transcriptional regulator
MHGYSIVQKVEKLTDGAVRLSPGTMYGSLSKMEKDGLIRLAPGTMYGSLSKMEKDGLIRFLREEEKRKIYEITDLGTEVLQLELKRIRRLYRTILEEI